MATQTLEFNCGPGLSITCKLFAMGSDTVLGSVVATPYANDASRYYLDFTDLTDGAYRLVGFIGGVPGYVQEVYDILATTGRYFPRSEQRAPLLSEIASSLEGIPRYGETQRWDNGTETIDVLIEEAP